MSERLIGQHLKKYLEVRPANAAGSLPWTLYPAARVPKGFSPPTRVHISPPGPLEKKVQLLKRHSTTAMRVM